MFLESNMINKMIQDFARTHRRLIGVKGDRSLV